MASGFFALFDDIAYLLDDVATSAKIATKKTAGILGDDLAVNAKKASGFVSERELPVIWAITKGSFLNKFIILPFIFLLSAYAPYIITPLLMIGGLYLAFEGAEKIYEYLFHKDVNEKMIENFNEKKKIKSAILTDFILSLEIIIIALGSVSNEPILKQIAVVTFVAIVATIGVYGLVALIVRMDDIGYRLIETKKIAFVKIGYLLIKALPKIIRALAFIGTIAMLLVAGGIYLHNIKALHDLFHSIPSLLSELIVGLVIGAATFAIVESFRKFLPKSSS